MSKDEINILKGWLAFALDVEPEFFAKMKDKYGKETINKIMNSI